MLSRNLPRPKNSEKGFTMIELIIVIVIIGIISAVAVPRFVDLKANAQIGVAKGVGGALSGTIAAKHADFLLNDTAYNASDVATDTQYAGGIVAADVVGTDDVSIVLTYRGDTYTWTWNAQAGDTPAYLTEPAGGF